jgi:hypothetical protein
VARPKTKRTIVEEEIPDDGPRILPADPSEETLDYALKQFDDREGLELKYYMVQPGGAAFIGSFSDIVPDSQLQDWYPLGGKFEIRIYIHGEFRDRRFTLIGPRPGGATGNGSAAENAEIRRLNDKLDMLMNQQRNSGPQTTMEGLAQVIKTVSEIQRAPAENGTGLLEAIRLGVSLAKSGGNIDEDDSFLGVVKSVVKEAGPGIAHALMTSRGAPPGPPPVAALPPPNPDEQMNILLKQGIVFLKKKAIANADPGLYIDLAVDNRESETFAPFIHAVLSSEFETFVTVDPEIGKPPYEQFIQWSRISPGRSGTWQTLETMRSLARRGANSAAIQARLRGIVSGCPGDLLLCLDFWIRQYFVYRGESEEIVRTPELMLSELERNGFFDGDCDDVSTLYAAFLLASGWRCRFVAIRYDETPDFKHVFVEVQTAQGWHAVDPTVPVGTPYHETERMVCDL